MTTVSFLAQRKHLITSLDSLLYQLHTLSFFLSPSLWSYLCRCATQFQFAKTRDLDSNRSLLFFYVVAVLVNGSSLWTHVQRGSGGVMGGSSGTGGGEGKSVVLDFVGMARRPSRAQLLLLDFTIIFLQMVLSTVSYETSLLKAMPEETLDPLSPGWDSDWEELGKWTNGRSGTVGLGHDATAISTTSSTSATTIPTANLDSNMDPESLVHRSRPSFSNLAFSPSSSSSSSSSYPPPLSTKPPRKKRSSKSRTKSKVGTWSNESQPLLFSIRLAHIVHRLTSPVPATPQSGPIHSVPIEDGASIPTSHSRTPSNSTRTSRGRRRESQSQGQGGRRSSEEPFRLGGLGLSVLSLPALTTLRLARNFRMAVLAGQRGGRTSSGSGAALARGEERESLMANGEGTRRSRVGSDADDRDGDSSSSADVEQGVGSRTRTRSRLRGGSDAGDPDDRRFPGAMD